MTIRVPDISINLLPASHKVVNDEQKILFIGQISAASAARGLTLYTNVGINADEDALFGKNSMLATMIRAARVYNKVSRFDAIALDDVAAGTQAAGSATFAGTATEAGSITFYIGSKNENPVLNHTYVIPVAVGDTADIAGGKLADAITADLYAPVTAVNTTGTVAITAFHKGTEGNSIGIEISGRVAGLTCALDGMTGGATDPAVTAVFALVQDIRYQTIVYPSYVRDAAKTFLDARFNMDKKIRDGVGIDFMTDSTANIVTACNAKNSPSIVIGANHLYSSPVKFFVGSSVFELNTVIASTIAAIRALRLTKDVSLAQFISASYGAKDSFGGMHMASFPYFNTLLPGLPLEESGKGFSDDDLTALTEAGALTIGNNIANTAVIMGTAVTTYKTDTASEPDPSFKYLEYVDTGVTCREYMYNNLRERFAQSRLTSGSMVVGYSMANKEMIEAFITGLYVDLAGVALTRIGKDPVTGVDWLVYFKTNLNVTLDLSIGKVTVNMLLPIVTQLRSMIISMQFSFSANS